MIGTPEKSRGCRMSGMNIRFLQGSSVLSLYAITARKHGPTPLMFPFSLVFQSLLVSAFQAVTMVSAVWFLSHSCIGSEQTSSLTLSHLQVAFWN